MAGTGYMVLRQGDDHGTGELVWAQIDTRVAPSADAALRDAALTHGEGTFVAVPLRSWNPTAFKVEPRAVAVKAS